MPTIITNGFASYDAGAGGGALDKSTIFEIEGQLFEDVKAGVPFNPFGADRMTELPGLINASRFLGRYMPASTSDQNYEDMIAAFDANVLQTVVLRPESGAASTTIHQLTITFYLSKGPTSGWSHGGFTHYPVDGFIQSVVHYDGVTTYTW